MLTSRSFALPLISYTFLGLEVVTVTAYEAVTARSLRLPSRSIAYIFLSIYLFCACGFLANISYTDDRLPSVYDGSKTNAPNTPKPQPNSASLPIIITYDSHYPNLPGFLTGCLIFCVLSAGNTSLYVSSRTLYGMTLDLEGTNLFSRYLHKLSTVVARTGVPAAALCASALAFIWLPFLQLRGIEIQGVSISDDMHYSKLKRRLIGTAYKCFGCIIKYKLLDSMGILVTSIHSLLLLVEHPPQ